MSQYIGLVLNENLPNAPFLWVVINSKYFSDPCPQKATAGNSAIWLFTLLFSVGAFAVITQRYSNWHTLAFSPNNNVLRLRDSGTESPKKKSWLPFCFNKMTNSNSKYSPNLITAKKSWNIETISGKHI